MKRIVLLWILLPLLASGCIVSKKKYEAMVDERDMLEQRLNKALDENKNLQGNLEKALTDFEAMKYELHESNALKSDKVAELMRESEVFKNETERLSQALEETRRRVRTQQTTSAERAKELEELRKRVSKLTSDTSRLQYALRMSEERKSKTREALTKVQDKYNAQMAALESAKSELEQSRIKLSTLEQQLVEKNQVLSGISEAFIELRKQMLSAKSNGTPIDPNQNSNVDKIARLLGHY